MTLAGINSISGAGSSTLVISGKRKRQSSLVLHLSGGSTCESDNDAVSDFSLSDSSVVSSNKAKLSTAPIIINGKLVVDGVKRYHCTFEGCSKSYRKPVRLEEHERKHTGERPFVCSTCQNTYYRETHLQAHKRSHLPDSARPFSCPYDGCEKKFWTAQHLKRHEELHSGDKPFKCTEPGCDQSFSKHNQLRSHIASTHCSSGTKIFRCEHHGCTKSFATGQKLKAHAKTHEERRYTCSHSVCLQKDTQEFFANWTAFQAHTRTAHPPRCPYPSCNGKVFTQQKGLRAHLKIHEQREIEEALMITAEADDEGDSSGRPVKKRRGREVGRDWKCEAEGCDKDFKSKNALETHVRVAHLQRRDFICSAEGCGASFGYKHVLQRHAARTHAVTAEFDKNLHHASPGAWPEEAPAEKAPSASSSANIIDVLTGKAYEDRTKKRLSAQKALVCPYPNMNGLRAAGAATSRPAEAGRQTSLPCTFVFSRAYDFRRHLSAAHGLEVGREEATVLVELLRCGK